VTRSFVRNEVIAAYAVDVAPGEWHPFDGLCGTCRGCGRTRNGRSLHWSEDARTAPNTEVCEQCAGRGFGQSEGLDAAD
jgi:hypothetical protein